MDGYGCRVARRPTRARLAVWRSLVGAQASISRTVDAELRAEHELPLEWYLVLLHLWEAPEQHLRMQQLADALVMPPSSLSRLIDRMQERGFVVRHRCEEDGRGLFVALTARGRGRYRRARPTFLRAIHDHFTSHLSETDVVVLRRAFAKIPAGELVDVAE